jgi:hypothetical protein
MEVKSDCVSRTISATAAKLIFESFRITGLDVW